MTRSYAANEAEVPTGILSDLFLRTVEKYQSDPAFLRHRDGIWETISYQEASEMVRWVTSAIQSLGLRRGDRAAILSENRLEWALTDYACLCAGVQDVPIYSTLPAVQVSYILRDSGSRLVFVSTEEQLAKVMEVKDECPDLEHVITFDEQPGPSDFIMTWERMLEVGREAGLTRGEFLEMARDVRPDDVATVIYTSGTTGPPKGVMLTHGNLFSNVEASSRVLDVYRGDRTLSFLPLSHVFQRMVDYLLLSRGCCIAHARSLLTLTKDFPTIRPTVVVSTPRLYEKIYTGVMDQEGFKGRIIRWATKVGDTWAGETLAGRKPSRALLAKRALADRLVFRAIRDRFGGRIRWFVSGGAPLSPDIGRFFYSVGLLILEGYGLTETSPVTNVNSDRDFRIGTVGRPVPGTEVRIAEDGEILVRGPQVMKGYLGRPEATTEVITEDGWFHTGDIGELDDDGFLKITDRKKDIIVTSGGKNIAPQAIEGVLVTSPFVDQAILVGDRRKFPSVLVVPNFTKLEAWAQGQGIRSLDRRELLKQPKVQDLMRQEVMAKFRDLARFETPKKIGLLVTPFSIEDGTLTPSLKVKRRVVEHRYAELIETLYAEEFRAEHVFVA